MSEAKFRELLARHGLDVTTMKDLKSEAFAKWLDEKDDLAHFRNEFHYPPSKSSLLDINQGKDSVYLCGNSLGLQPKCTAEFVLEELKVWQEKGVVGHFNHDFKRPWANIDELPRKEMSRIVGALESEVAITSTLTSNLHQLLCTFFKPKGKRTKLMVEEHAFPSDMYAVKSQLENRGLSIEDHLLIVKPAPNSHLIPTATIVEMIEKEGEQIGVVLLAGVQYYTGQFFDLGLISRVAHEKGCLVGIDLAHAVGNVPLRLHEWGVDFAVWCSYKYLNAGPGGIGGLFIHADLHQRMREEFSPLYGWWGHEFATRFDMPAEFKPANGASSLQLSNPSVLNMAALLASLSIFAKTSMQELRKKSILLTGYLEFLLLELLLPDMVDIISPSNVEERGCQISILLRRADARGLNDELLKSGIICDDRKPNCLRLSPVPLYNSFEDVFKAITALIKHIAD